MPGTGAGMGEAKNACSSTPVPLVPGMDWDRAVWELKGQIPPKRFLTASQFTSTCDPYVSSPQ